MSTAQKYHYAFILGSHPELSFLELQQVLQHEPGIHLSRKREVAFVRTQQPLDAETLMNTLGGTIKIVEIVGNFEEDLLIDWLFEQINTETKFHFGFSVYALDTHVSLNKASKTLQTLGINIKKALKEAGISARFVTSREPQLSSVIVQKERLLKNGVDIVILKNADSILFGKTLVVQPFEAFSKRDYGRPGRDVRSGMLPPKIARMMVNIAAPSKTDVILDPFCGSGTILTEALLLGYTKIVGSDISAKAIRDTIENLHWFKLPAVPVHLADVKSISSVVQPGSVHCVVAEGDLGRPTPKYPDLECKALMSLYPEAFTALSRILAPGGKIVVALPAWKTPQRMITLPLESHFTNCGLEPFHPPLFYGRPHAKVFRHIYFLRKKTN